MNLEENKPLVNILKCAILEQRRVNRRNFVLIVILLMMLIGTNSAWLVYEYKMADASSSTESVLVQDAGSSSNNENNFANQEVHVDGEDGNVR